MSVLRRTKIDCTTTRGISLSASMGDDMLMSDVESLGTDLWEHRGRECYVYYVLEDDCVHSKPLAEPTSAPVV